MKWKKADPKIAERFDAALPPVPAAERRKMFGYPCCFVNGNFFAGMHEDNVVVRLPNNLRDRFPALAEAKVFDPMRTGKGMKDWWLIPPEVVKSDAKLTQLMAETFAQVVKLPPKKPKPKAPRKVSNR
ncbi:MAG: TfoX/Sxy family protein [Myxococcaceae bacterium]